MFQAIVPACGRTLRFLSMSGNAMGDSAVHSLCQLLQVSKALNALDLSHNLLTTDSLSTLFSSALGRGHW